LPVNIVAFETSSETVSVAIARGGEIFTRVYANAGQQSGELTLPAMHALLDEAGLKVDQLDLVVFGQGPGAFTGVRVACGVAQGLAYGLGKRVLALPSTIAVAEQVADAKQILVAMDARMGEMYVAAYVRDANAPAGFVEVLAPCLCGADAAELSSLPAGDWVGVGSAFTIAEFASPIQARLPGRLVTCEKISHPLAAALLNVAKRVFAAQGVAATIAPAEATPLYVRNNVALTIEERRQRALANTAAETEAVI
jgi:tRNA threonylcarbamoyladenosine biosynthesis protein TsaB